MDHGRATKDSEPWEDQCQVIKIQTPRRNQAAIRIQSPEGTKVKVQPCMRVCWEDFEHSDRIYLWYQVSFGYDAEKHTGGKVWSKRPLGATALQNWDRSYAGTALGLPEQRRVVDSQGLKENCWAGRASSWTLGTLPTPISTSIHPPTWQTPLQQERNATIIHPGSTDLIHFQTLQINVCMPSLCNFSHIHFVFSSF